MTGNSKVGRRRLFVLAAGGLLALGVAGCGGGSSPDGGGSGPTAQTRTKVQEMFSGSVQALMRGGAPLNIGGMGSGGGGGGGAAENPDGATGARPLPMIGEFIHNVAAVPRPARSRAIISRMHPDNGEGGSGGHDPSEPPPLPPPTFYFDEYLGLWVDIQDTPAKSSYLLYEDEAKTRPAGSIVTVYPADWETFPQTFSSTYQFTAGFLAGSHGAYETVTNADYSSRSTYENVYADGWKDNGRSVWTAHGDFTWSSRIEMPDGYWTEDRGTFRANGSGGTHSETSDGYVADYSYNPDGSGRGRISGLAPGLPAVVSWDTWGNTTIRYADGTTERIPGWGFFSGGGGGIGFAEGGGAAVGSGSASQ